jgi:hypothetical protein
MTTTVDSSVGSVGSGALTQELELAEAFSQKQPEQSSLTPIHFWVFALVWFLFGVGQQSVILLVGKSKLSRWRSILLYLLLLAPLFVILQQFLSAGGMDPSRVGIKGPVEFTLLFLVVVGVTLLISPPLARLLIK